MKARGWLMGWAISSPAWAQGGSAPLPSPTYYLLQALLSLACVVGLIYLAYWALKRMQSPHARSTPRGPARLVQSLPLSGGQVLHLVGLGERLHMIVTGPQGATLVGDVDEQPSDRTEN
jgi:hypothetical protein